MNRQQKQMKHHENKGWQLHMEPDYNFSGTWFQRLFKRKTYQLLTKNTTKKLFHIRYTLHIYWKRVLHC